MVGASMTQFLTLVANRDAVSLTQAHIDRVRDAIGGGAVTGLSPAEAADIACPSVPNLERVREAIGAAAIDAIATTSIDRRKRLLVADMDSTIVAGETLDELAAYAGLGDKVAAITARAMNGEIDFKDALRERVAMLKGPDRPPRYREPGSIPGSRPARPNWWRR